MNLNLINKQSAIDNFFKRNEISDSQNEDDYRLEDFQKRVDEWLKAIKEEDRAIFLYLLSNYTYISRRKIINEFKRLYKVYTEIEPNYIDTVFMPVTSAGGVMNGATNLISCFEAAIRRNKDVNKKRIAIQPQEFHDSYEINDVKNVVLIDDLIGSGATLRDSLVRIQENMPKYLIDKKIYVLSLFNLEDGIKNIEKYSKKKKWSISIINTELSKKIFSNPEFYSDSIISKSHRKVVKKYEKKLNEKELKKGLYNLGFNQSELLLSLYYNTPNNTLSTFWKELEDSWFPIFPREEDDHIFEKRNLSLKEILEEKKTTEKIRENIFRQILKEERRR